MAPQIDERPVGHEAVDLLPSKSKGFWNREQTQIGQLANDIGDWIQKSGSKIRNFSLKESDSDRAYDQMKDKWRAQRINTLPPPERSPYDWKTRPAAENPLFNLIAKTDAVSDKPSRTLAFEPGDPVRRIEHGPDGKQIDTPVQVVDLASSRAAWITVKGDKYVQADYQFEHAPGTEKAARAAEARTTIDAAWAKSNERNTTTMDTSTAKAEIAHGKQDLREAKQERADAFWQQTINAGRQAQATQPQKQQEKDKVAEPQQG